MDLEHIHVRAKLSGSKFQITFGHTQTHPYIYIHTHIHATYYKYIYLQI